MWLLSAVALAGPPATAVRAYGDVVVTWDDDRGLAAFAAADGAPRWTRTLVDRPYGWQPLGALAGDIVPDSTPATRIALDGSAAAPLDFGPRSRCAVLQAEGAAALSCIDHFSALDPQTGALFGPSYPLAPTCHASGGDVERLCTYDGPAPVPVARRGGVTVLFGEEPHIEPPGRMLVGIAADGREAWRVSLAGGVEAGAHGELCWAAAPDGVVAVDCASGAARWRASLDGFRQFSSTDAGIVAVGEAAALCLDWDDGHVLWTVPAAPGERVVVASFRSVQDPLSGEPGLPLVAAGPSVVRLVDVASGAPVARLTLAEADVLFGTPWGFVRRSTAGATRLLGPTFAELARLDLDDSAYVHLAADDTWLVITLYKRTWLVDRRTGKVRKRLDGQYHPVWFGGGRVVLHRPPLGDGGEVVFLP